MCVAKIFCGCSTDFTDRPSLLLSCDFTPNFTSPYGSASGPDIVSVRSRNRYLTPPIRRRISVKCILIPVNRGDEPRLPTTVGRKRLAISLVTDLRTRMSHRLFFVEPLFDFDFAARFLIL